MAMNIIGQNQKSYFPFMKKKNVSFARDAPIQLVDSWDHLSISTTFLIKDFEI